MSDDPEISNDEAGGKFSLKEQTLFFRWAFYTYMVGIPVMSFFYTIFYVFRPEPTIFGKDFIYSVFPNLEREHDYLAGIGWSDFANNIVNYQANMTLVCVFCTILYYLMIFPKMARESSTSEIVLWKFAIATIILCALPSLYLFSIWPFERIPIGRVISLSGRFSYFHVWILLWTLTWSFNMGITLLLVKAICGDRKKFGPEA